MNESTKKKAEKIVNKIMSDLSDRRGIGDELDAIDDDIKKDMKDNWVAIICKIMDDD